MTSMIPTPKSQGHSRTRRPRSAVDIFLVILGFCGHVDLFASAVPKVSSLPPPRTSPRPSPSATNANKAQQAALPKLDDLIELNSLMIQKQYSAAESAVVKSASTKWPAPFQVLLRDHAQALLHLAPAAKLPDQFTQSSAADRQKSAEYLGLKAAEKLASTPAVPKAPLPLPPGDLAKPTLAVLKTAWTLGLTGEAQRIAAKVRLAPHGKNCNGFWAYSQWVLGRVSRSAQNRKDFYKYQRSLADHLLNNACSHQSFEMTQEEFRDFRRAELLWAARLLWENEELPSAQKDAESVLQEIVLAKDPKDSGVLLEAVQVLFGRIRYESETPSSNIGALAKLRKQLTDTGMLVPALAEYIALRSALLAFEMKDYKLCADELTSSSAAQKAAPSEFFDSPAGRRNYTQHQYWMAKCSSLSGEENAEAIVRSAWNEIHRYGATGYYAMLIEQDFPGLLVEAAQEDESAKEFSISDDIHPALAPDLVNDLVNTAAMISESRKLGELPRSSLIWQAPATWAVGVIKGNERALFDSNPSALTNAWDMLLAADRASDVIMGAGKLAQNFRLDHPKAQKIRKYLYPRVFQEAFAEASEKCSVDSLLLYSVARQESLFNPKATSPAGARGLVQLMPSVWTKLLKEHPEWGLSDNPFDLRSNVILGACHLRDSLAIFRGNTALSLAGYNAGTSVVEGWFRRRFRGDFPLFFESIPFAETQDYVKQITRSIYHAQKVWDRMPNSKRANPN